MTDQMFIRGVVLCPCGGQVISNSGKTIFDYRTGQVFCWRCREAYSADEAYAVREEGKTVTIPTEPKSQAEPGSESK